MKKSKVFRACLAVWLIACMGIAAAETYDTLCDAGSADRADTAAWIEIPGADMCLPVMQHATDDSFYSSHDPSGVESPTGALYTQAAYNAADFSDPVTVIYGSSKSEGAPLRDMQEIFSGSFDKCRDITVYLPDRTLEYKVFAAVPYSSVHILHYYDFSQQRRYDSFFDGVYSTRMLGMHLDEDNRPEFGDQVLILSTGLRGDGMQRYLVMAKLVETNLH